MYKKLILLIGIAFLLVITPLSLFAETNVKVAIFPFTAFSETQQDKLVRKIEQMIKEKLEAEGASVVISDLKVDTRNWGYEEFKAQGIKLGADYVLNGSVFIVGQSISIDAALRSVYDKKGVLPVYANAEGGESLFAAVNKLSRSVIGQVFQKVIITDIGITGQKRIEADAILRIIDTQPGDIIRLDKITKDLRKIYEMGYFDDVTVEQKVHDEGVKLVFNVIEKPSIRKVKFKKNFVYEDEELAEFVDSRTGSILNLHKIMADMKRIRLMYNEKNYHNCQVDYEIEPLNDSQADIIFTITEGNKIKVQQITFEGNHFFDDDDIKDAMETSEEGFFSFFTSSGDLNETEVKNDVIRIESLYKNNGFVDAKVSDPDIKVGDEMISIHFKIQEGTQYFVKKIDLAGDLIFSKEEITEVIKSAESELYNRDNIREDMLSITDMYANQGFANAQIKPLIKRLEDENAVVITYVIDKKNPVYFNRINIHGNLKTRDKVIRREIMVEEKGPFSKEKIQLSYKNLNRLQYFESIDVQTTQTEKEDEYNLDVTVQERETGTFSFGGGYSSENGAFFMGSVEERNLFGRGQAAKFAAQISKDSVYYNISFFEPYILDTPVSGGVDLYKEDRDYDYYDKDAIGFTLRLGYKLYDYTRIGLAYNIEDFDITNVETQNTDMTPGSFLSSSIKPFIKFDNRDDLFAPTEGSKHMFSIEYAGQFLGSDIDFTKYLAETGWYFPLFWKFTGMLRAEGGYIDDRSSDTINIDYKKFYLGGMNSVRGFDKFDISGRRPGETKRKGGEKYLQFNAEITIPLLEEYKVVGVLFYDRGDVYRTSEDIAVDDMYSSAGLGFRWYSPMGPLRIEYGWVIDGKDIKERGDGQFEFSVGASF